LANWFYKDVNENNIYVPTVRGGQMEGKDVKEMQSSFSKVYARKAQLTDRFYLHLFALLPEVETLFGGDFSKQKEMFAAMLTYCLKGVVNNQSLTLAGESLARTHGRYCLGPRETEIAGRAMMAALEDVLGPDLTPEQRVVWEQAIASVMQLLQPEPQSNSVPHS
jgi:hemoglobin-like flavoprotein